MLAAASIVAAAMLAFPFVWRRAMSITAPTSEALAKLVQAQANYDAKLAAGVSSGIAPVRAQLDAANATVAELTQTIADNEAAVTAQANALLADSTAPAVAPVDSVPVDATAEPVADTAA